MAKATTPKKPNGKAGSAQHLGFEQTLWATAEEAEGDGEPFEQKMKRLTAKLQFAESAKLERRSGGI
jgi:hypothetical protein